MGGSRPTSAGFDPSDAAFPPPAAQPSEAPPLTPPAPSAMERAFDDDDEPVGAANYWSRRLEPPLDDQAAVWAAAAEQEQAEQEGEGAASSSSQRTSPDPRGERTSLPPSPCAPPPAGFTPPPPSVTPPLHSRSIAVPPAVFERLRLRRRRTSLDTALADGGAGLFAGIRWTNRTRAPPRRLGSRRRRRRCHNDSSRRWRCPTRRRRLRRRCYSDEITANRDVTRVWHTENWSLNNGQIPNPSVVRVAYGTGYHRGEGNRRASGNGPVSEPPPENPNVTDSLSFASL
jgi:hypothetical protein